MKNYINWALRLIPAIILLQTLFFKFTAHPDSVAIFSKLHAEPFGRIFSGVLELITAFLILNPKTTFWGAVLGLVTMIGAIASHIFILGIDTNNDGGKLFYLALTVFVFCVILLIKFKKGKYE
ncbi:MAG: DoxX family protein [Chlorobi bacterium]|nr:DoxX family protein [Chlorobiota bacterium]